MVGLILLTYPFCCVLGQDEIMIYIKKILVISALVFTMVTVYPTAVFASVLYLTPDSNNVRPGEVMAVKVNLDTQGEPVNAVSAFISYSEDKLEVAWIKDWGSAFSINAESIATAGLIKISRGNITGVNGKINIATVGFKGKSLGTANVSFVDGSAAPRAIDSSDSLNLSRSYGGIYNIMQTKGLLSRQQAILGEAVDLKSNARPFLIVVAILGMAAIAAFKRVKL